MTGTTERIDRDSLFRFIREQFLQSQAMAEVQRATLVQLEATTNALNEATAVIKAMQRDFATTKKK